MAYQSKNTDEHVTFADALLSKRYRKAQNDFLNQVDTLIDWRPIRTLINKKYTKRQNAIGAPAYDVILLFKIVAFGDMGTTSVIVLWRSASMIRSPFPDSWG